MRTGYKFIIVSTLKNHKVTYKSPSVFDTVSDAQIAGNDYKQMMNIMIASTYNNSDVIDVIPCITHN